MNNNKLSELLHHVGGRLLGSTTYRKVVVDQFHWVYYNSPETWLTTNWMGIPTQKCPLDMWIYQEIIFDAKPDLLIETGTAYGGSALFFATLMDAIGHGHVATVDVLDVPGRPQHPRITYINGSSTSEDSLATLQRIAEGAGSVMVILDSDHSRDHVAKELLLYCDLVTPGNYLVVEDSNVNGHPVNRTHGPGPMEALEEFLATNNDFYIDSQKERYMMTFNPKGYLRRAR